MNSKIPDFSKSTSINWGTVDNSPGQLLSHIELSGDTGYQVIIDNADPLIWISSSIISWAASGQAAPQITVPHRNDWAKDGNYWIGSTIRFHGDNRDVLYKIISYEGDYSYGYYIAQWPD